jgi:hypothetical protein
MRLELLPNEVLLELFRYMDDTHLLCRFYNLNSRFNSLLFDHTKDFHLNFKSISRDNFDLICRWHLSRIIDRVVSLHLSNDDDTPCQIDLFLFNGVKLRQFTHLKSFALCNFGCSNTFNRILSDLPKLRHLKYLKIDHVQFNINNKSEFINIIWSLRKLSYFHISDDVWELNRRFTSALNVSSPIERLYMMKTRFTLSQLAHLFKCTPYLENLSISFSCHDDFPWGHPGRFFTGASSLLKNMLPTLRALNMNFTGLQRQLEYIFQAMPNLHSMKIEVQSEYIDGCMWQKMISNHLSKLKVFHLRMSLPSRSVDDLWYRPFRKLETFQTSFWVDEHRWFVRCDWNTEGALRARLCHGLLYTVPYAFDTFYYLNQLYSKSTCPNEIEVCSYNRVHTLLLDCSLERKCISRLPNCFPSIRHLIINRDFENIDSICPRLNQLKTLDIANSSFNSDLPSHLQALCDRAPRLQTIVCRDNIWPCLSVRCKSIQRLVIHDDMYYNVRDCVNLCNSTIFNPCESLEINIRTRDSVLHFLRVLPYLRVFIF